MLGVKIEVVEGPTIFINASFMEVCGFSRRQSSILRTVRTEGCVSICILHVVRALPLVDLRTLIFGPSIYFFAF
jgi:hypothetical protein